MEVSLSFFSGVGVCVFLQPFLIRGCVCVLATLAAASEEDSDNTGIHTNPPSTERMVMMMVVTVFVGAKIMRRA